MTATASSGIVAERGLFAPVLALRRLALAWGPALPIIIVCSATLILPCLVLTRASFAEATGTGFTLSNWTAVFSSKSAQVQILNSLQLCAVVATIAVIVGTPLTWTMTRLGRRGRAFNLGILTVAQNFSGIGLAFGFTAAIGAYGMITLMLRAGGLTFNPPAGSSFWGFVIAYEYGFVPMFVLMTLPAMRSIRPEWWDACQCCGAGRLRFWISIALPMLLPYIAAGWILTFTAAMSLYGLPVALAAEGRPIYPLITLDMSRTMLGSLFGSQRMPVMAVILMIFAALSLVLYRILLKRGAKWL
ncbi:ABC transporter permease subunit [Mycoplana ramosa]|uniref:ABC transporter permease subunit n=1 Tax=Mycoplana ramosa TaxID=40837 RepID=A0ABW3YYM3_MYCRA